MSSTSKQEHVTTTCALCMISKWHKQRRFHSASPRRCLEFSPPRLCLDLSASTKLPWAHPCVLRASGFISSRSSIQTVPLQSLPTFFLFFFRIISPLYSVPHFDVHLRYIWSLNDRITEGRLAFSIFYKLTYFKLLAFLGCSSKSCCRARAI